MQKKIVMCIAVLLLLTSSGMAMLKVLEPELSEELRVIAKEHLVSLQNADTINIKYSWVKEFWNTEVDIYMVEAVVNKGVDEKKVTVPILIGEKRVLDNKEFALLDKENQKLSPLEPEMRILLTPKQSQANSSRNNKDYLIIVPLILVIIILVSGKIYRLNSGK